VTVDCGQRLGGKQEFVKIDQQVEVWNRFNNAWVPGFEIAYLEAGGYRLRRASDGELLCNVTGKSDLRPSGPRRRLSNQRFGARPG
jgi:hypothetical protein